MADSKATTGETLAGEPAQSVAMHLIFSDSNALQKRTYRLDAVCAGGHGLWREAEVKARALQAAATWAGCSFRWATA